MLNTVLLLATEAMEGTEKGFGLDFNILRTNLFNLAILVGVVVFYGRKVLTNILAQRQSKIAETIQEAEERNQKASSALAVEQKKLAESKIEAEKIVATAKERAKSLAAEIAAKAEVDVARMQETAAKNLGAEQERVMMELRQRIATLAMESVESKLKGGLDDSTQQGLIDRSLAQLGGR
ncbi:MAG: ATP synthase subunit b [Chroococcopsis gigantea SAG 12.99]|jgi:F-type H+-transporting ATPase subunit b|nr:F0F1 ATP synthase subunit B [Chlorogloea purpurea SAG 13.99]MDV3002222.1 ATP synthase subunit b [Chroococcopsis gigantea SAG 12.99]